MQRQSDKPKATERVLLTPSAHHGQPTAWQWGPARSPRAAPMGPLRASWETGLRGALEKE